MYSHTFPHLSERFFKGTTWPPVEAVLHLVDGDHVFGLLYREMYYRHLYASGKPTLEQRIDSWANYRELFTVVLSKNINMLLPNLWLWDMVDEFVYQFQSFCQYRCAGPPPPPPPCSSAGHRGLDAALCTPPAAPPPPPPPPPITSCTCTRMRTCRAVRSVVAPGIRMGRRAPRCCASAALGSTLPPASPKGSTRAVAVPAGLPGARGLLTSPPPLRCHTKPDSPAMSGLQHALAAITCRPLHAGYTPTPIPLSLSITHPPQNPDVASHLPSPAPPAPRPRPPVAAAETSARSCAALHCGPIAVAVAVAGASWPASRPRRWSCWPRPTAGVCGTRGASSRSSRSSSRGQPSARSCRSQVRGWGW